MRSGSARTSGDAPGIRDVHFSFACIAGLLLLDRSMILDEYLATRFEVTEERNWPEIFGIVTAWHPWGVDTSPQQNQMADDMLRRRLDLLGLSRARVVGKSPDGCHREEGWAFWPADERMTVQLGEEFQQNAVYHVNGTELFVISCTGEERIGMGDWRHRLD